jgi:hypothetical protein
VNTRGADSETTLTRVMLSSSHLELETKLSSTDSGTTRNTVHPAVLASSPATFAASEWMMAGRTTSGMAVTPDDDNDVCSESHAGKRSPSESESGCADFATCAASNIAPQWC